MDNIFINEPGIKEFNVILMQEKLYKEDRMHLRLCIRNYKHIRSLSQFVSNSKLFFISRFYKSRSDYQSFQFIHNLTNSITYKKLYRFKKRSKSIMADYLNNIEQFFSYLSLQIISRRRYDCYLNKMKSIFLNSDNLFNICDMVTCHDKHFETNFNNNNNGSTNIDISMLPVDKPYEKFFTSSFFTSSFSDLSDSTQEMEDKPFRNTIVESFFISDSLFPEIGDDRYHIIESRVNKLPKNCLNENLQTNNMSKRANENKQFNINNSILFRNNNMKVQQSHKLDIMNQYPNEDIPKIIDLNSFISEKNEQINFDFKKIKITNKRMTSGILEEKNPNIQKNNDLKKNYDYILKKNTTLNSNYKFIKVYHTNALPRRVSINSTTRQRKVSFANSCDDMPHNTTEVKPILQKPGKNKRIRITKTKQTVYIKRLS